MFVGYERDSSLSLATGQADVGTGPFTQDSADPPTKAKKSRWRPKILSLLFFQKAFKRRRRRTTRVDEHEKFESDHRNSDSFPLQPSSAPILRSDTDISPDDDRDALLDHSVGNGSPQPSEAWESIPNKSKRRVSFSSFAVHQIFQPEEQISTVKRVDGASIVASAQRLAGRSRRLTGRRKVHIQRRRSRKKRPPSRRYQSMEAAAGWESFSEASDDDFRLNSYSNQRSSPVIECRDPLGIARAVAQSLSDEESKGNLEDNSPKKLADQQPSGQMILFAAFEEHFPSLDGHDGEREKAARIIQNWIRKRVEERRHVNLAKTFGEWVNYDVPMELVNVSHVDPYDITFGPLSSGESGTDSLVDGACDVTVAAATAIQRVFRSFLRRKKLGKEGESEPRTSAKSANQSRRRGSKARRRHSLMERQTSGRSRRSKNKRSASWRPSSSTRQSVSDQRQGRSDLYKDKPRQRRNRSVPRSRSERSIQHRDSYSTPSEASVEGGDGVKSPLEPPFCRHGDSAGPSGASSEHRGSSRKSNEAATTIQRAYRLSHGRTTKEIGDPVHVLEVSAEMRDAAATIQKYFRMHRSGTGGQSYDDTVHGNVAELDGHSSGQQTASRDENNEILGAGDHNSIKTNFNAVADPAALQNQAAIRIQRWFRLFSQAQKDDRKRILLEGLSVISREAKTGKLIPQPIISNVEAARRIQRMYRRWIEHFTEERASFLKHRLQMIEGARLKELRALEINLPQRKELFRMQVDMSFEMKARLFEDVENSLNMYWKTYNKLQKNHSKLQEEMMRAQKENHEHKEALTSVERELSLLEPKVIMRANRESKLRQSLDSYKEKIPELQHCVAYRQMLCFSETRLRRIFMNGTREMKRTIKLLTLGSASDSDESLSSVDDSSQQRDDGGDGTSGDGRRSPSDGCTNKTASNRLVDKSFDKNHLDDNSSSTCSEGEPAPKDMKRCLVGLYNTPSTATKPHYSIQKNSEPSGDYETRERIPVQKQMSAMLMDDNNDTSDYSDNSEEIVFDEIADFADAVGPGGTQAQLEQGDSDEFEPSAHSFPGESLLDKLTLGSIFGDE